MPRGTHPNSRAALERNRCKGQFTHEMAVINGEKGRTARNELRSISEELKTMLNETGDDGISNKHRMAEIVMMKAADSPKWFELMLKLAEEMPAENISLINTKPDPIAVQRMVQKLHEHDAEKKDGSSI